MTCQTLSQAVRKLREQGIEFDRAYNQIFPKDSIFGRYGIHAYFNNGDNVNVAYYTSAMSALSILPFGGRRDDTPLEQREKVDISYIE